MQSRIQGPSQRVAVASHGASRMFCPSATHNLAYLCMRLYFKQQRSLSSWKAFPRHPPVTWAEEALSQRSTCNLTARSGPLMERGSLHVGLVRPCPALKCCPANGIPLRRHGVNDLTFCLEVVIDDDCLASCGCCELVAEATAAGLRAAGLLSSQQVLDVHT